MLLHDTEFSAIEYDDKKSLVRHVWKDATESMTEDQFKEEMQKLAEVFEQYKPKYVFVDQRDFEFVVIPSLQTWVDQNVNRILVENKCEKLAFVVPEELLAKLSVSQTLQESYSQNLNVRFFDDYHEAEAWLGI